MSRSEMVEELKHLVRSRFARDVYLKQDDDGLARSLEHLRANHEKVRREGHIDAGGFGLRLAKE